MATVSKSAKLPSTYFFQTETTVRKGCFGKKIEKTTAYLIKATYGKDGTVLTRKVSDVGIRVIVKDNKGRIKQGLNFWEKFKKNHNTVVLKDFQEASNRSFKTFEFNKKDLGRFICDLDAKARAKSPEWLFGPDEARLDRPTYVSSQTPLHSKFRAVQADHETNTEIVQDHILYLAQAKKAYATYNGSVEQYVQKHTPPSVDTGEDFDFLKDVPLPGIDSGDESVSSLSAGSSIGDEALTTDQIQERAAEQAKPRARRRALKLVDNLKYQEPRAN